MEEEQSALGSMDGNVVKSLEESYYWLRRSALHGCIAGYSTSLEMVAGEAVPINEQTFHDKRVAMEPCGALTEEPKSRTFSDTDRLNEGVNCNLGEKSEMKIVDNLSETNITMSESRQSDNMPENDPIRNSISANLTGMSNTSEIDRALENDTSESFSAPSCAFNGNDTTSSSCKLHDYDKVPHLSEAGETLVLPENKELDGNSSAALSQHVSIVPMFPSDDSQHLVQEMCPKVCQAVADNYVFLKWQSNYASTEGFLCKTDAIQCLTDQIDEVDSTVEVNVTDSSALCFDSDIYFTRLSEDCYRIKWTWVNTCGEELFARSQGESNVELPEVDHPFTDVSSSVGERAVHQMPQSVISLMDNISTRASALIPKHEATPIHALAESNIPDPVDLTLTSSHTEFENVKSDTCLPGEIIINKINKEYVPSVDSEVQTECTQTSDTGFQTDNVSISVEAQTEGEIVQCCQCNAYSFIPLGEQFVIKLKEEMSQRISLEHLIKIVEKDAWIVRQELMDEKEIVIGLHGEAADLKGQLTHARHISSALKTRNDELETSLEGARNMINKLEQQMSNTTYFNSGIDYMLEAKLAQGRALEAISKVEVLQKELLHSQSEVQKLLKQLGQLSQEKNTMVSSSVHKDLLQIANDKVTDAELRSLQLENEVLALKEENRQLRAFPSSSESDLPFPLINKPYKFMFTEQIDPYKEIMSMKYDMLNLHASSLSLRAESPPFQSYKPVPEVKVKEDVKAKEQAAIDSLSTSDEFVLPDFGDISYNRLAPTSTETSATLSEQSLVQNKGYRSSSLIATGSDSEESDWSDDEISDVTPRAPKPQTHNKALPGVLDGNRIKPQLPAKPFIAPKPKGTLLHPESIGNRQRTVSFNLIQQTEVGVSFDEDPSVPTLTVHRKPRGPQGRHRPARFSE